jgi:hypothetical protein
MLLPDMEDVKNRMIGSMCRCGRCAAIIYVESIQSSINLVADGCSYCGSNEIIYKKDNYVELCPECGQEATALPTCYYDGDSRNTVWLCRNCKRTAYGISGVYQYPLYWYRSKQGPKFLV